MKDYYAILDLPVTATPSEIKKAYRKLAMQYHPDKQHTDPYALARFNEIKEAYETLMNPARKEQHLQERWLQKAGGYWKPEETITPPVILKQVLELNRSISRMDVHRMDHNLVEKKITHFLREEVVQKLLSFNDSEINRFIVDKLLHCTHPLPLTHTKRITGLLQPLAQNDPHQLQRINNLLIRKKKAQQRDQLKPLLIFILIALICMLIYSAGI